jgi:hypothetical protein
VEVTLAATRRESLRRALVLEYFTIRRNLAICLAIRACCQRVVRLGVGGPIAGLGIALFAAKEGRELWTTKDLCCR